MVLNESQISKAIIDLKRCYSEQQRILHEADQINLRELPVCWECEAQRAFSESHIVIKNNILVKINNLIELFGIALEECKEGLYQVDIDLKSMNTRTIR